jgi:hypothetical protein
MVRSNKKKRMCCNVQPGLALVFKYSSILLLAIFANFNVAFAQQQKWASQYVKWTFDKSVDVWNIDQQVWVPEPNQTSYMPLQWSWKGGNGDGGYMGLQQADNPASQNVRFSLWNATEAQGRDCRKFGGEGVGYTCTLPVRIDPAKFYRLRLWKLDAVKDGQWWGGWLIDVENGKLTEHLIGKIKVSASYNFVDPSSITNFVEFWGDHVAPCGKVPASVIGFTPPAVNYQGKGSGSYEAYSKYSGSDRASGNVCMNGTESNGALITARRYNFGFANGVMMFLGGPSKTPVFDSKKYPTPPGMPNN